MVNQQKLVEEFGVQPKIDVDEEIKKRVQFLKQHVLEARASGLLVAISGGVDSAVTAGLCKLATDELAQETGQPYETLGVLQPYGEQEDIEDSYAIVKALQLQSVVETNIEDAVDEIALEVEYAMKGIGVNRHMSIKGKGNVKARVRMVIQYALAFERNLLVAGSDHAAERLTGFFTKYGDGAVDLLPLATLNKRQVYAVGAKLGIPDSVLQKIPTAGLWPGQTDEQELGLTYEQIDDYLEGKTVEPEVAEKLERIYRTTQHKRMPIPTI